MARRYDWDYWKYQIPFLGRAYRAADDEDYWNRYQRLTGQKIRYPGRNYASHGENLITQASSTSKRVFREMYK